MENNFLMAFGLTLFAGLSTGVGSAMAFLARTTSTRFLSVSLGFSAGVMIFVSFVEILPDAQGHLVSELGRTGGSWAATAAFFGGVIFAAILDRIIPSYQNPHEVHVPENGCGDLQKKNLYRLGMISAVAIAIHNFPEGLATFASAMENPQIGVSIAIAIAIHNIPEGISISVPVYCATGSKKKAFWYSFASGMSEPVGALLSYWVLYRFITPTGVGVLLGLVAGIMVFISMDELFPAAREYGKGHLAIDGLILGMAVMACSLLLIQ
jgi:zinc transporter, ZIP family